MKKGFIKWEELNKDCLHRYKRDLPLGQQWGFSDSFGNFITNGRGEGFRIHGGTRYKEKCAIVDALNKRDYEIYLLKRKEKKENG